MVGLGLGNQERILCTKRIVPCVRSHCCRAWLNSLDIFSYSLRAFEAALTIDGVLCRLKTHSEIPKEPIRSDSAVFAGTSDGIPFASNSSSNREERFLNAPGS